MGNRAKLIAEIINHLEQMDGDSLHSQMAPPKPEGEGIEISKIEPLDGKDKGPMDDLVASKEKEAGKEESMDENEPTDDELEELSSLFK